MELYAYEGLRMKKYKKQIAVSLLLGSMASCHTSREDNRFTGSEPINQEEKVAYKRALLQCYHSGGTRIVKIQGNLRCF